MTTDDHAGLGRAVRIGTRGSALARWQANFVAEALRDRWPDLEVEVEIITTQGDEIQDRPLYEVGGKGLFVTRIEDQLLSGTIDLAVHSMKDLPSRLPDGLIVACTPAREDPRDAFVSHGVGSLTDLPSGARLGTTSLRRAALARRIKPDLEVVPIRGNVPTRLRKLDDGDVDAVLLACAGLRRLGLEDRITDALDVEKFCPAAGQGIVAVECREADAAVRAVLEPLTDPDTAAAASAERALLGRLDADCTVPIGCHARIQHSDLVVNAVVADPSARPCFFATKVGPPTDGARLGTELADALLKLGASAVLEAARSSRT